MELLRIFRSCARRPKCSPTRFLNLLDGDFLFLRLDDVLQHLLGSGQIDFHAGERGVGHQADQRAFELANVRFDRAGDVFGDVIRQAHSLAFRLLLQNGDFGFEIGRLDIGDQAPFETRAQPLLNGGNFLGRAIGGNHDLLLLIVERVEGVEEFLLGALARGDELNVVHHQHVHVAEAVAEGRHALEADRGNHFVGEFFGADVGEAQRRIAALERVADGLHQMRLAEAHSAIEEKRVVGFRGLLGDGDGGGVSELVRCADDKRVEGVARIELMARGIEIELGLGDTVTGGAAAGSGSAQINSSARPGRPISTSTACRSSP